MRCALPSAHWTVIGMAGMQTENNTAAQTAINAISRSDTRDAAIGAPQCGQRSALFIFDIRHRNAISLFKVVFKVFVLLFFVIDPGFSSFGFRKCRPLFLVTPHIERLFAGGVFWDVVEIHIRLKQRKVANAALFEILAVMPEKVLESLSRDDVVAPLAFMDNGGAKPLLLDP